MKVSVAVIIMSCFFLCACSSSNEEIPPKPARTYGLLRITLTGLNSNSPNAIGQWVNADGQQLSMQAITLQGRLPTLTPRLTQVMDAVAGSPATRFVTTVFDITNTTSSVYSNLILYALNDPAQSVGGTAFTSIVTANGNPLTDVAVARSFRPIPGMRYNRTAIEVATNNAHLHFLTTQEMTSLKAQLPSLGLAANVEPLQYGFVASNFSGNRNIEASGCTEVNCNRGYINIAFRFNRGSNTSTTPDRATLVFVAGNETMAIGSQSLEEQTSNFINGQAASSTQATNFVEVRTLLGNSYTANNENYLCRVVTAGSLANPLFFLPATATATDCPPPASLSITPNSVNLNAGEAALPLTATVQNSVADVNWILSPNVGTLSVNTGKSVSYLPPANVGSNTLVTITARLSDGSAQANSQVTVQSAVQPSITLNQSNIVAKYGDGGVGFTASVMNGTGTINWMLSPNVGTLSATTGTAVVYIPPSFIGNPTDVTLTASLNGTSAQKSAIISVQVPDNQSLNCTAIDPSGNQGIVGYLSRISFFPNETAEFKISSTGDHSFHMAVYRDGQQSELVYLQNNVLGQFQPTPTSRLYEQDLGWSTSASLTIPSTWKSGLYRAKLIDASTRVCYSMVFVVKNSSIARPPIVVLASNFTWQAYNDWGGASFYSCYAGTCNGRSTASIINLKRPNRVILGETLSAGTLVILKWLEQQGYSYDVITDSDLDADPAVLDGYRILVLPRHSEYWTSNMRDHLDQFLSRGRYLIGLGGNQIYWKVVVSSNQMEVKKYADDPQHTLANEIGGLWRNIGRPEAKILGNAYISAGKGASDLAPYQVVAPNHWALAGTTLQQGQTFGDVCSGWETDKVDPVNSPSNVELIARGTNIDPAKPNMAGGDMVYYAHPAGGAVFAVGSLAFFGDNCRNDAIVSRIVHNMFERFLGR